VPDALVIVPLLIASPLLGCFWTWCIVETCLTIEDLLLDAVDVLRGDR
jgi:hypothetical protein